MRFKPTAWSEGANLEFYGGMPGKIEAEIIYVNRAHNWYLARWFVNGIPMREAFKY